MKIKDYISKFQNIFFFWVLEKNLSGYKAVLDVGCGDNSALGNIKRNFKSEGIDAYKKSILISKKKRLHDKYKIGDIEKLSTYYKKNSFDACVAIDVIEHFKKKDAIKLIKDMEQVANKKVIILTPNGFYEQHDYLGNPYQIHRSGWNKNDLRKLGYQVYGLRGLKYLRNEEAGIKYKPWILWGTFSFVDRKSVV